jgi:hypothetical protein
MSMPAEVELVLLLSPATAFTSPKELVENVLLVEATTIRVLTLRVSLQALLTMLIVNTLLVGIRECLIGICYVLELLLGSIGVVLVLVRVELDGHLLESLLDLFLCGASLQAQHLIVILLGICKRRCENNETQK